MLEVLCVLHVQPLTSIYVYYNFLHFSAVQHLRRLQLRVHQVVLVLTHHGHVLYVLLDFLVHSSHHLELVLMELILLPVFLLLIFCLTKDSTSCLVCPAGSSCHDPTQTPVSCIAGTYSSGGAYICSNCPEGTYSNVTGAQVCVACPAGSSCLFSNSSPQLCPIGSSTNGLSSQTNCQSCIQGTYAPNAGSVFCLQCPAGFYCPFPGFSFCKFISMIRFRSISNKVLTRLCVSSGCDSV